jgi:hypothetical protein
MNTTKLTLEHTFELSDKFFHDLTITFIETSYIGWREVMEYSHHQDAEGNYIVDTASIVELDESENVPAVVEATLLTKELLMLGIQRLANPAFKVAKSTKVQLFECLSDPENEFPDIELADCIVQAALSGELKYG